MEVKFGRAELARWFQEQKSARKALGYQIARAYVKQIQLLQAAQTVQDLSKIPQLHFKALSGPLKGKFSVRLSGYMRLVLVVEGQVVTVEEVSKHHEE